MRALEEAGALKGVLAARAVKLGESRQVAEVALAAADAQVAEAWAQMNPLNSGLFKG